MGLDRGLNSSSTNPLGIDDDDYTATTRGAQGPKGDDGASTQDYIDKYNTVVTSAAAAGTSATNAASSNSQAAAQASTATTQAGISTTKAGEAATSATNSANSATASASSASTASTQASNASTSASTATTQASNASTSASTATTKASEASASASTASTQATNSSNSATASANSATAAANSATAGANSATASANSASGASTSATNAASSLSTFQGIFYGSLSSVPTSNVVTGDLYFDSGTNAMKVYNGTAWQVVAPTVTTVDNSTWSGADLAVVNGGTGASSAGAARDNLGLEIGVDIETFNANKYPAPTVTGTSTAATNASFHIASAGGITITLPASPSAGNYVIIKDGTGAAETTTFTVARNGSNIASSATDLTFDKNFAEIVMTYVNSTIGWSV